MDTPTDKDKASDYCSKCRLPLQYGFCVGCDAVEGAALEKKKEDDDEEYYERRRERR